MLRKHEKSNLLLDKYFYIIENGVKIIFEELDQIKIFMLEKNKTDKFLDDHYYGELDEDTELSYNDYWHLREWYFFKDAYASEEESEIIIQNVINNRKKLLSI
jgi:hypothetical protein